MGDIYQNSTLNIAATKSSSGSQGCFSTRLESHVDACHIELSEANLGPDTSKHLFLWNCHLFDRYVEDSPLLSRAWVVQERYLSRRILHFGEDGLDPKYELWDQIVGHYTAEHLTYPAKDKLVAISGLAIKIGIDDELVAGLWRRWMPYQILWRSDRPSQTEAPQIMKAPHGRGLPSMDP